MGWMNDRMTLSLRKEAREAIRTGKLPDAPPDRMWGGPAGGADCTICGAPVPPDQMEFEIEFAHHGDRAGPDRHHLHVQCFEAWELERRENALVSEETSSTADGDRPPAPPSAARARSEPKRDAP